MSPELNTARWFAKMDLSASVQKQQGHLSASAVKRELTMRQNLFRVQIALYVAALLFF